MHLFFYSMGLLLLLAPIESQSKKRLTRKQRFDLKILEITAQAGSPISQYELAQMFASLRSIRNENLAFKWYKKAAQQDHTEAQVHLAVRYWAGLGVSQSDKLALFWLKKTLKQNPHHQEALFYMGVIEIEKSEKENTDYNTKQKHQEEGSNFLKKASEQGHQLARTPLKRNRN